MIIDIPDEDSVVRWKHSDNEDWKCAEISDLINAYEKSGRWELTFRGMGTEYYVCSNCHIGRAVIDGIDGDYHLDDFRYCQHCGAKMERNDNGKD